jgi:hypothetical protein
MSATLPAHMYQLCRNTNLVISGGQLKRSGIMPQSPRETCITVGGRKNVPLA